MFPSYVEKYAEKDLRVVPVLKKHCPIKDWISIDFTEDKEKYQNYGIGLSLGDCDLVVLDIDYVTIDSMVKLGEVLTALEKGTDYVNVYVDSITEIGQILVAELQKKYPDRKDSFPLWGDYNLYIRKIVKRFRDLAPYNVFITALDKVETDELNNRFIIPDLNGKVASQLVQFFDEVFYVVIDKEGGRTLLTGGHDKIIVKDRSNKLERFEEMNLQTIKDKICLT